MKHFLAFAAAISFCCHLARADILIGSDGSYSDSKVVSQSGKDVVLDPGNGAAQQTVGRDHFTRILVTDEHGALVSDSATAGTTAVSAAARWHLPKDPPAPAILAGNAGPTYYVIPLRGEVGETLVASALEKSLADAVLRKPTVVVLEINSPGGAVAEVESLTKVLHHYNKLLRIVALTDQDLSAAAITTLSVKEIYVKPSSTIGAAVAFKVGPNGLPQDVEQKFRSAWRAMARNSAEEGGHEPLLADAMMDNSMELHLEIEGGKGVVREGPPRNSSDEWLVRKGGILTLTSHEAVHCGLAAGEAEDFDELGKALHYDHWTECKGLGTVLADALPLRVSAVKAAASEIGKELVKDLRDAERADPTQTRTLFVRNTMTGSPFAPQIPSTPIPSTPGVPRPPGIPPLPPGPGGFGGGGPRSRTFVSVDQAHWKQRSLACVVALLGVEKGLADAIALGEAAGETAPVEHIKELLGKVQEARGKLYDERNKYGEGQAYSATQPARQVARPGGAGGGAGAGVGPIQSVADAEEGLKAGGPQQIFAAMYLSRADVVPAEQKKVISLLTPLIEPLADGRSRRYIEAYAKWAGKEEVPELEKILDAPPPATTGVRMNPSWGDALLALERLEPATAEKIVAERKGEAAFRVTVQGFLRRAKILYPEQGAAIERLSGMLGEGY